MVFQCWWWDLLEVSEHRVNDLTRYIDEESYRDDWWFIQAFRRFEDLEN